MGYTMDWLLFAWVSILSSLLVEVSGEHSASLTAIMDERFMKECVDRHNAARSSVQPPASDMLHMTWDEGLAITARAWARNCDYRHNDHRTHPNFSSVGVGENIWTGRPPSSYTVKHVIDDWVNEKEDYTYTTTECKPTRKQFWGCLHYTQVAWASTYKVGCAVQICPNGVEKGFTGKEGAFFVCNYAPAGNVVGRQPYQRDTALSSCGPSCVAVLTIRPLALLATFLAAYIVQHYYPNIFCYE